MRTFLLFLSVAFLLPLGAASLTSSNCGEITMSNLNANFSNYTAAFNVRYERDAPEEVNGVVIINIQLTEWDPAVPPAIAPPDNDDIPMWSADNSLYASQGKVRLRGLLLGSATVNVSPIITYGISDQSGNPCFKVDQAKRFLNNDQWNPCNVTVVQPYDCDQQATISDPSEIELDAGRFRQSVNSNGSDKSAISLLSANPFHEALTFSVTSPTDQTAILQLFAFTGQRVAERSVPLYAGDNRVDLDNLGTLPPGTYAYRLTDEAGNTSSGMVVKQ